MTILQVWQYRRCILQCSSQFHTTCVSFKITQLCRCHSKLTLGVKVSVDCCLSLVCGDVCRVYPPPPEGSWERLQPPSEVRWHHRQNMFKGLQHLKRDSGAQIQYDNLQNFFVFIVITICDHVVFLHSLSRIYVGYIHTYGAWNSINWVFRCCNYPSSYSWIWHQQTHRAAPEHPNTVIMRTDLNSVCFVCFVGIVICSFSPPLTCCVKMTLHTDNLLWIQWHRTPEYSFNSVITHYTFPSISNRKLIMTPSIMVRCVRSDAIAGVIKCCCVFVHVKVGADVMKVCMRVWSRMYLL